MAGCFQGVKLVGSEVASAEIVLQTENAMR
jgi:hypothetical protein